VPDRWLGNGSRMSGDVHVRICESRRVRFPPATQLSRGVSWQRRLPAPERFIAGLSAPAPSARNPAQSITILLKPSTKPETAESNDAKH
jgi:hypothetical protein